jgi:hypothetical protein
MRVKWPISADVIDGFDRESSFKPFTGPTPPAAVYQFRIKTVKYVAGTRDKNAQLRVGLELVPRPGKDEKNYKGYFVTGFLNISPNNAFTYVPFVDAIGVRGRDFTERMIADENGTVSRIGPWRNDQKTLILAKLQDGTDQKGVPRKEISWYGPLEDAPADDDDDFDDEEEAEDDEYADDEVDTEEEYDDEEEYEEEEPAPPIRSRKSSGTRRAAPARATSKRRAARDEEDPF